MKVHSHFLQPLNATCLSSMCLDNLSVWQVDSLDVAMFDLYIGMYLGNGFEGGERERVSTHSYMVRSTV